VPANAANLPSQVHIALAGTDSDGNSNSMSVTWSTSTQTSSSTVKYGTSSGVYTNTVTGYSRSYYETFHNHVVLGTLSSDTLYYYVVGDSTGGWSSEYTFRSAPLSSKLRGNFSFAVFGDLGLVNGEASNNYLKSIKDSIEFVAHAGDVGYADDSFLHLGCATSFCYEDSFDQYMVSIEPWASQLPYMVAPGNHEADCHDPACLVSKDKKEKLSNFTAYNERFLMPSDVSDGVMNMYYSFNYGNVHFISLDTETAYAGAPEETKYVLPCGGFSTVFLPWLENDLIKANENREERPWILVMGHHPLYDGDSINTALQTAVEDLFYKYGVDVFFGGHEHFYERDYPVYKGVPEADYINPVATTHLLIGGAGNDEMHGVSSIDRTKDPSPNKGEGYTSWIPGTSDGAWTALTDKDDHVGIGKVTIVDDSTLTFEYIRTMTSTVFDSITLTRDHSTYAKQFKKTA